MELPFNDAGHTHGPTLHFITGCPLCDAAKAARNQAIEHLAEALHLLSQIGQSDDGPTVRLTLSPIGVTGEDAERCHSIDLTAKKAEGLADAIDSMHAYAASQPPATIPADSTAREEIASGEWSAAAVKQCTPDLFADVTDVFDALDPISLLDDVLNSPNPGESAEAYEDLVNGEPRSEQ